MGISMKERIRGLDDVKIILYSWGANNENVLADNLTKLGFEVIFFQKECRHYTRDMELAMELIPFIHGKQAKAVVSFNYFPILSMICNTCQIPYYAWVYDCPHFTLYAKQIQLPCNHIGVFDREMVRNLENYGVGTAFHAPLAADAAYFGRMIGQASEAEKKRFRCDVSFVGSLYTDEHNYYDGLKNGGSDCCVDMDLLIRQQCFCYGEDYLRRALSEGRLDLAMIREKMADQGLMLGEDYFAEEEDILMAAVLEKKVTVEERRMLLTKLAQGSRASDRNHIDEAAGTDRAAYAGYTFRLYTGSAANGLPELDRCNCGTVDYHTQMPLVFAGSRINLNISLRSIRSGIPLRVLDIMACGGFVLTNRQPEVTEYFTEGVEIVTFDSMEDCVEKVRYYLAHEEERRRIAEAGRRKVEETFSYEAGLARLFDGV